MYRLVLHFDVYHKQTIWRNTWDEIVTAWNIYTRNWNIAGYEVFLPEEKEPCNAYWR